MSLLKYWSIYANLSSTRCHKTQVSNLSILNVNRHHWSIHCLPVGRAMKKSTYLVCILSFLFDRDAQCSFYNLVKSQSCCQKMIYSTRAAMKSFRQRLTFLFFSRFSSGSNRLLVDRLYWKAIMIAISCLYTYRYFFV